MFITIATPTYNRAALLPRLYQSLCRQSYKNFEWIIVDDGSTDSTESVVKGFIDEGIIDISYRKKSNGGKHTAINLAAKEARGELFFIADSDDWLPETAIADVIEGYSSVKDDDSFCGVCGLDQYADGSIVGSGLPQQTIDAFPYDIREKWAVTGDLKEVFHTDVIRQFPFPEIKGERFCPEVLIWNRIGLKYKLRYFNKPIYFVEYQPDGLTNSITLARMKNPVASMMTYAEWFAISTSFKTKLRSAVNYWRFAFCAPKDLRISISGWGRFLLPIGWLCHYKDNRSYKSCNLEQGGVLA